MNELIFVKFRFEALADFITLINLINHTDFIDHTDKRLEHGFL